MYKLYRSIYVLKQASKSLNILFDNIIKSFGFVKNPNESYIYKWVKDHVIIFLILYMDDILLMGNDVGIITEVKIWLSKTLSMKYLGERPYILGIWIFRDKAKGIIGLFQRMYIETMLKWFNIKFSKRGFLPYRHGLCLFKDIGY